MSFGERLRERRLACRLTMDALAILIGTSRQTIQRYESGRIARPPYEKIEALAAALSTTPGELIGWQDDTEQPPAGSGLLPAHYVLAPDDAMAGDRILERDLVYYLPELEGKDGQIVVGHLDGELTIRRFWQNGDTILLTATAPDVRPIMITPDDASRWQPLGVAVVLRTLL